MNGKLTALNSVRSGGEGPCHLEFTLDGSALLVANYVGATVSILKILEDGSLGAAIDTIQRNGTALPHSRQDSAHPHGLLGADGGKFYVADLGTNSVAHYSVPMAGADSKLLSEIQVHDGAGPRHLTLLRSSVLHRAPLFFYLYPPKRCSCL